MGTGSTENTAPKHVHTQENADDTVPKQVNAQVEKACNCRSKTDCPLNNQCKSGSLVYRATVKTSAQETHTYIGCSNDFKERWANHKQSFKNISRKNETVLSQHVWNKGLAPKPDITWEIITHAQTYKKGNRFCDLCTTEKLAIAKEIGKLSCLNKRTDFTNKCVHKMRHRLSNIKPK